MTTVTVRITSFDPKSPEQQRCVEKEMAVSDHDLRDVELAAAALTKLAVVEFNRGLIFEEQEAWRIR